jgi:hypothetical protein
MQTTLMQQTPRQTLTRSKWSNARSTKWPNARSRRVKAEPPWVSRRP